MILPETMRRAADALLDARVASRLETLTRGVLFAMITAKLKQTGIIVVIAVIGLGTVAALMAYDGRPVQPALMKVDSAVQDGGRKNAPESNVFSAAKTTPEDPAPRENQEQLRAEAELEEAHQKLDQLLADAALKQIELDATTKRIEKAIEFLKGPTSRSESARRTVDEKEVQLTRDSEIYRTIWIDLARLKRKIVRQSRTLGVTPEHAPSTSSELTRRFDELEKKIDRIIESLPIK